MRRMNRWNVVVAGCGLVAIALLAKAAVAVAHANLELGFDTFVGSLVAAGISIVLLKMQAAPTLGIAAGDGELTVRFDGWDRLWTLRRSVTVPTASVRSVSVSRVDGRQVRTALHKKHRGTALPGLIRACSESTTQGVELWDVRAAAEDVLCIDLDDAAPFRRIVLQVADPEAARVSLLRTR
jgi:hypothetical protein